MRHALQTLVIAMLLAVAPIAIATANAQQAADSALAPAATPDAGKAASQDIRKRSLFGDRGAATSPAVQTGPFSGAFAWLMAMQHKVHRALAQAVKDIKAQSPISAALVLGALSFAYGVLHAAGPGHGKAVISSYVLANERTVKRGIMLSFLAAAIQGLSALIVVGVLVLALNATSLEIKATERWIETGSWALVALIGLWLVVGQLRAMLAARGKAAAPATHTNSSRDAAASKLQDFVGEHTHAHGPDCGCAHGAADQVTLVRQARASSPGVTFAPTSAAAAATPAEAHDKGHADVHMHEHDACCGHAHMPAPEDIQGRLSWSKALAIAFSVGIRPCTGAILVLVFAISQGLFWAGVFATFAMALGTAITVSALAALALISRDAAKRMAGGESRWGRRVEQGIGLAGALLVTAMGVAFFVGSLQPAAPF
ncbi:MAG: nickel/cobalt transporter [Hyphomicrobiaceae bacterium]